ncbi:hypothetical protein [Saccharothrix sp. NRRL B-16348]|uniref:hypothetical protein n=1 Tax=Saccharothrix sp. NRRL B-16348 TaxID=1415542 RepID=UPI0012F7694A|nr:hypothetical protein [Saccharothrix sp. NRRL B-16348]
MIQATISTGTAATGSVGTDSTRTSSSARQSGADLSSRVVTFVGCRGAVVATGADEVGAMVGTTPP